MNFNQSKLIAIFLVVVLLISCMGCRNTPDNNSSINSSNTESTHSDVDSSTSEESSSDSFSNEEKEDDSDSMSSGFEIIDTNNTVENAKPKDDGDPNSSKYDKSSRISFSKYSVIYDADISENTERDIYKIARSMFKIFGEYPKYDGDINLSESTKEILVGATNRKESGKALSILQNNRSNCFYDYIIVVIDNKIVIEGGSEDALSAAVRFFTETFLDDEEVKIPTNYQYIYAEDKSTNMSINNKDISNFVITCESKPSRMVYLGCEELQGAIAATSDYAIPIDKTDKPEKYKNRIEVSISNKDLDTYSITVEDNILKIKAGHTYSANAALHALAANIKNISSDKKFNIPNGYKFSGKYNKETFNSLGYKLVLSDEFTDGNINGALWHVAGKYKKDIVPEGGTSYVTANSEGYAYDIIDNIFIRNGNMVLKNSLDIIDGHKVYGGSEVYSKAFFQFGMFEIRAKIPKGSGTWPSFWAVAERTLEKNYSAEIDVFEFFGNDKSAISNLHSWWTAGRTIAGHQATDTQIENGHIQHLGSSDGNGYKLPGGKALSDDYHTYTCEWTPEYIKFSVDGYNYCTVSLRSFLTDPNYGYSVNEFMMFLNKTVYIRFGNSQNREGCPAPDENTIFDNEYLIDYCHLYQQDGIGSFELRN